MRRRAETEHVEQQRLVIAVPAILAETRSPASIRARQSRRRSAPTANQRAGKARRRERVPPAPLPSSRSKYAAAVNAPASRMAVSIVESSHAQARRRSSCRESGSRNLGSRSRPARPLRAVPEKPQRRERSLDRSARVTRASARRRPRKLASANPTAAMLAGALAAACYRQATRFAGLVSFQK